jgi:predicted aconitase
LSLDLTTDERVILSGAQGEGAAMALRIVTEAARLMGATSLIPIASAHIDGALYHGDSGTLFAERLVELGAKIAVRSTLNVGALDLTGCAKINLPPHETDMARRMMRAYIKLGCEPTWTCAPYQAGHRPALGSNVAWGESNAVVFCNSVLGARTNRYGDFLDIACAISGSAPNYGLHLTENRYARFDVDLSTLPLSLIATETFWPIFGSLYGRLAGSSIGVVTGVAKHPGEDALKAFGAASASTGGVGLFHVLGVTPEAPDIETVTGELPLRETVIITEAMFEDQRRRMATVNGATQIDAVAIGSPHLSATELTQLDHLINARKLAIPFYACTGRHALSEIEQNGTRSSLEIAGVTIVADTCVVVTPIMKELSGGVLMTNSGKFAQYAPGNTGYGVVFGSMAECVESAVTGRPSYA